MEQRLLEEAASTAAWLLVHLLFVAGGTVVSGHHREGSVLELGTEQTQPLASPNSRAGKAKISPAVNVLVHTNRQVDAAKPPMQPQERQPVDPLLAANAVEAKPVPTNQLPFTEREQIASRYASTCSEKNVQLRLTLGDGTRLQRIGTRYLFRLASGQLVIIDEQGSVSDTNVRYSVGVRNVDVPPRVTDHARSRIGRVEMRHVQIGLVMDNSVEVQMHRSLYAFLRSRGLEQLESNHIYEAEVSGTRPLDFRWSHTRFDQG